MDPERNGINVHQAVRAGSIFCPVGGIFDMSYPRSKLRRGRVQDGGATCPTLTCNPECLWVVDGIEYENGDDGMKVVKNVRVRKLTERECFRLMGLGDSDIDKLLDSGIAPSQLYKMAGNSIVVDVLCEIFRTLLIDKSGKEPGHTPKLF